MHHISFATTAGSAWMRKFAIALLEEGISLQDICGRKSTEIKENTGSSANQ